MGSLTQINVVVVVGGDGDDVAPLLLYNMHVSCHRHFFPVLLLNQR